MDARPAFTSRRPDTISDDDMSDDSGGSVEMIAEGAQGFAGECAVLTTAGLVAVSELAGKPFVAIVDGAEVAVPRPGFAPRGRARVLHISLRCGLEVRVSGDCSFFTPSGWRRAADLARSDSLLISEHADIALAPFHVDHTRDQWGDALARHYTLANCAGNAPVRRDAFTLIHSITCAETEVYSCPGAKGAPFAASGFVVKTAA